MRTAVALLLVLLAVLACSKLERAAELYEMPIPDAEALWDAASQVIYDYGRACPRDRLQARHTGLACGGEPLVAVHCLDVPAGGNPRRPSSSNTRQFLRRCEDASPCSWRESTRSLNDRLQPSCVEIH